MGSINTNKEIQNVAVAGATGLLGSLVLKSLIQAKRFNVTVLGRGGQDIVTPGASLAVVDYNDINSLVSALKGQDAVVSTLSREATLMQISLIDAAVLAGVKRFIPSEFGGNLQNANLRQLPNYVNKVRVEEHLEETSRNHGITYTYVYNNVFVDWSIQMGILLNFKTGQVHLYNGGTRPFSMIRVATAAGAVVGILTHLEETKNRSVCIHEVLMSQKDLLAYAKEAVPDQEWHIEHVDILELEKQAKAQQKPSVPNMSIFHAFAAKGSFCEGYGNQFKDDDNKLLGIKPMSADEIKAMLASIAKK